MSVQSGDVYWMLQEAIWQLLSLMGPCYAITFPIIQITLCVRGQVAFPSGGT